MPRPQREPRTVLEYLIRQSNQTYEEHAAEFPKLGEPATITARHLARLARCEQGIADTTPAISRALQAKFGMPAKDLLRPWSAGTDLALASRDQDGPTVDDADYAEMPGRLTMARIRKLRIGVDQAIGDDALSEASLDDWDQTALRLGEDTRYRSSGPLLTELTNDFAELKRQLAKRRPLSALRRLTVVTAQMAGLMSLTLLKLNENNEARDWARTARIAADEAGDPAVRAWVRAQEAYAHFYGGSLTSAIHVARQAQAAANGMPCVGVALAAALEARAHAALGRPQHTRDALLRAQDALTSLGSDHIAPSAFGYDEAQLRFHEGNAYTHLHDTVAAWTAQQRALDLYPTNDYMDRALIHLDRASCLAYDGDVSSAMAHATQTMLDLTDQQRTGLITLRAQQVFDAVPAKHRALPAAQDLREILMATTEGDEI